MTKQNFIAVIIGITASFLAFKFLIEDEGAMAVFRVVVEAQSKWQYAVSLALFLFAFSISGRDGDGHGGSGIR